MFFLRFKSFKCHEKLGILGVLLGGKALIRIQLFQRKGEGHIPPTDVIMNYKETGH